MRTSKIHFKIPPTALCPTGYVPMNVHDAASAMDYAQRKGYGVLLLEDVTKYPVNLMGGYFQCCGVMCPKDELQSRLDSMQSAIDRANYALTQQDVPVAFLEQLKRDLADLSST